MRPNQFNMRTSEFALLNSFSTNGKNVPAHRSLIDQLTRIKGKSNFEIFLTERDDQSEVDTIQICRLRANRREKQRELGKTCFPACPKRTTELMTCVHEGKSPMSPALNFILSLSHTSWTLLIHLQLLLQNW